MVRGSSRHEQSGPPDRADDACRASPSGSRSARTAIHRSRAPVTGHNEPWSRRHGHRRGVTAPDSCADRDLLEHIQVDIMCIIGARDSGPEAAPDPAPRTRRRPSGSRSSPASSPRQRGSPPPGGRPGPPPDAASRPRLATPWTSGSGGQPTRFAPGGPAGASVPARTAPCPDRARLPGSVSGPGFPGRAAAVTTDRPPLSRGRHHTARVTSQ